MTTTIQDLGRNISSLLWNHTAAQNITPFIDPQMSVSSPVGESTGISSLFELAQYWKTAFPDLSVTWLEESISRNRYSRSWTATGTHQGPFMQIQPTGKTVHYQGTTHYTFNPDGKLSQYSVTLDLPSLLAQLESLRAISPATIRRIR